MKKLSIANGTYTAQDGSIKTRWVNVGIINISQNGKEYMLLDPTINLAAFPREQGKDMVMVNIFDDTQQQPPAQQYQPQPQQYQPPQQNYQR